MGLFESVKLQHVFYLSADFKPEHEKWYCGHCVDPTPAGTGWIGEGSVQSHVRSDHLDGDEPEAGYDYMNGWDLRLALRRWRVRNEQGAEKFARQLETVGTVDDFLTDCGYDVFPDWND